MPAGVEGEVINGERCDLCLSSGDALVVRMTPFNTHDNLYISYDARGLLVSSIRKETMRKFRSLHGALCLSVFEPGLVHQHSGLWMHLLYLSVENSIVLVSNETIRFYIVHGYLSRMMGESSGERL